MITPIELARMGIRYFVRKLGWQTVSKIVEEAKPVTNRTAIDVDIRTWPTPESETVDK